MALVKANYEHRLVANRSPGGGGGGALREAAMSSGLKLSIRVLA